MLEGKWKSIPKGWDTNMLHSFTKTLVQDTEGDPDSFFVGCNEEIKAAGLRHSEILCKALQNHYLGEK